MRIKKQLHVSLKEQDAGAALDRLLRLLGAWHGVWAGRISRQPGDHLLNDNHFLISPATRGVSFVRL
jgi:hypothetical protein